jgi:hypothetical protein
MQDGWWKKIGAENDAFLYRGENQPGESAFERCNATV